MRSTDAAKSALKGPCSMLIRTTSAGLEHLNYFCSRQKTVLLVQNWIKRIRRQIWCQSIFLCRVNSQQIVSKNENLM